MGGFFGHVSNIHVRYYASELMQKLIPVEGFIVFGNIFDNLFKFISEVDFFKWVQLPKAITHQKKILETMKMLLDYNVEFSQHPRSVISGTIFNILKRGIDLFDKFTELCNSLQNDFRMIRELQSVCEEMLDCIILTLAVHSTIYNIGIVSTIYPEVEEKYVIFINKLIYESTNMNHPLYTVIRRPDKAAQITHLSFRSIHDHSKLIPKFIHKIKDTLMDKMHYSGLDKFEQQTLIDQLKLFKDNALEYPEEFLDPLSCTVISDPVKIPNIGDIFDRSTILTHIYESYPTPTNPYTREELTIEMFDEYNEQQNVKNEIKVFLEKKKLFESSQ